MPVEAFAPCNTCQLHDSHFPLTIRQVAAAHNIPDLKQRLVSAAPVEDDSSFELKLRPQRLAEIEADDFSQFPSLAYAKGFLLIYGKFLDVDVTPYLDAFEDSESVTVDGYSYLQENERAKPVSAPVVRRRAPAAGGKFLLFPFRRQASPSAFTPKPKTSLRSSELGQFSTIAQDLEGISCARF